MDLFSNLFSIFGSIFTALYPILIFFVLLLSPVILFYVYIYVFKFIFRPWEFIKLGYFDPLRILIFGRPGQGKTTLLVYEMIQALRMGHVVVSNVSINWHGYYFGGNWFTNLFNGFFRMIFFNRYYIRYTDKKKLKNLSMVEEINKNITSEEKLDRTRLRKARWHLEKEISDIEYFMNRVDDGMFSEFDYSPENYIHCDDLKEAIYKIIRIGLDDPDARFMLAFDEGFSYLDHGKKVDSLITEFFNQSRKMNTSVLIASQRPVAVYPSFRALVDFMVLVNKGHFGFSSRKYFVDTNADALPEQTQIEQNSGLLSRLFGKVEGNDYGKPYKKYKGKDVFYYFNTRQSYALEDLLKRYEQDMM
jgi:hypothetical protein